jgi:hypothetical protein
MHRIPHALPSATRTPGPARRRWLPVALLAITAAASAGAAEPLVRFDGGIGVQPLAAAGPNLVQGVSPGGLPWVIERLRADVGTDASISVDGRGLLLAGGNGVGTTGGQTVRARLFCAGVPHDSETVPMDARGDFRIQGFLNPFPPAVCNSPVLLVLGGTKGRRFAAGIPR